MGWNPNISFSLRDDEVTCGDLIIVKSVLDLLTQELINIKVGRQSNIDTLKRILDVGVFTNEEYTRLKKEFDVVKEDIRLFKDYCGRAGISRINNWTKRVDDNLSYAIGSKCWIKHFKDKTILAAELYDLLLDNNYEFTREERITFDSRYKGVIAATDKKERLKTISNLNLQTDIVDDTVDNPVDKYVEFNLNNGVSVKMCGTEIGSVDEILKIASGMAGPELGKKNGPEFTPEMLVNSDAENDSVSQEDEYIILTSDIIQDKWSEICKLNDKDNIKDACYKVLLILDDLLKKAGIEQIITSKDILLMCGDDNIPAIDVIKRVKIIMDSISIGANKNLVDNEEYKITKSDWDKILCVYENVPNEPDTSIIERVDVALSKLLEMVRSSTIDALLYNATFANNILSSIVREINKDSEVVWNNWSGIYSDFIKQQEDTSFFFEKLEDIITWLKSSIGENNLSESFVYKVEQEIESQIKLPVNVTNDPTSEDLDNLIKYVLSSISKVSDAMQKSMLLLRINDKMIIPLVKGSKVEGSRIYGDWCNVVDGFNKSEYNAGTLIEKFEDFLNWLLNSTTDIMSTESSIANFKSAKEFVDSINVFKFK